MEALGQMFQNIPTLLFVIIIQYRLLERVLVRKYPRSATILCMLVLDLLSGWLNVKLHIAGTPITNVFYYSFWMLFAFAMLYGGAVVKKVFLVMLIQCSSQVLFLMTQPLCFYWFGGNQNTFVKALELWSVFLTILWGLLMEYTGRKLQNLRYEMPPAYTWYLSVLILFVFTAVFLVQEFMLILYDGNLPLGAVAGGMAFAAMGAAVIAVSTFSADRQISQKLGRQQRDLQECYFKSREAEWRQMAGFRHDMKNHLLCLEQLLEQNKTSQASEYMAALTDTMAQIGTSVRTGNDYGDAIMGIKEREARELGITVTLDLILPREGWIQPSDLCILLSNGMDNAITACQQLEEGRKKWIEAKSFVQQNQLVIVIRNSKPQAVQVKQGRVYPKSRESGHGLGLGNVQEVVKRYQGLLELSAEDCFSFYVMIPGHGV